MTYFPFDNKFAAVFVRGDVTYASEYHYRYANLPSRTDPYLLYIRFAWTIFGCATMDESLAYHVLPEKEEHNPGLGSSAGCTDDMDSNNAREAAGDVDVDMSMDRAELDNLDSIFSELEGVWELLLCASVEFTFEQLAMKHLYPRSATTWTIILILPGLTSCGTSTCRSTLKLSRLVKVVKGEKWPAGSCPKWSSQVLLLLICTARTPPYLQHMKYILFEYKDPQCILQLVPDLASTKTQRMWNKGERNDI